MTGKSKRRDRRAARALLREAAAREGMQSDLLEDPKRLTADLALVKKSLRWGDATQKAKPDVISRLHGLVKKTGVARVTKEGDLVTDEELADKNAIAASSILVAIEGQQQKDDHLEQRLTAQSKPSPQTTINVGVNVDNRMDERRSRTRALIERAGAERGIQFAPSGGSEIVVVEDGNT